MPRAAHLRDALPARRFASTTALAVTFVLVALSSASPLRADPTLPAQTGRITDEASLLKPEDRIAIDTELADLEQKSTDQVAIVTLKSLQGYTIEDFGIALGRKWGIGQKGKDNGILLIIAPNEHKVRIEVGRRLEPIMTDLMSKLIIENAITPAFRKGDFAGGIRAGVRDIKDVLLGDAEAVKERAMGPRRTDSPDTMQIILLIFWICVVLYILCAVYRSAQAAQQAGVGRSRRHGSPVFIPGSSDSWGGGWSGSSSGGDSGGGWSGGGGDFGGGGASGSW
jgi:uncharacterized protein